MGFRQVKKTNKCKQISDIPVQNENVTPILNLFPEYSDLFHKTNQTLMSGNGSLPLNQRHYIAMMACTTYGCETLISMEKRSFLAVGGDQAWLNDPDRVPVKLRKLSEVNNLLAETPWLLKPYHIKKLTTGNDSWTISGIVHALVIISNYHALASFVLGSGQTNNKQESNISTLSNKQRQNISEANKSISFNMHSKSKKQEFCWDEHGFSVMSTFYSDMAYLVDDKMRESKNLSSSFLNEFEEEKYVKLNRSIWNHVQSLHGIHQDDYNHEETEEVLNGSIHKFVTVCCKGNSSSSRLLNKLGIDLGYSMKVFVSIIVMEAKLQSELVYALEAVIKHMT